MCLSLCVFSVLELHVNIVSPPYFWVSPLLIEPTEDQSLETLRANHPYFHARPWWNVQNWSCECRGPVEGLPVSPLCSFTLCQHLLFSSSPVFSCVHVGYSFLWIGGVLFSEYVSFVQVSTFEGMCGLHQGWCVTKNPMHILVQAFCGCASVFRINS